MKRSELKQLIKEELNEALGVPTGLVSAATNLYNDIISKLESLPQDVLNPSTEFILDGNYSFADYPIETVNLLIDIKKGKGPMVLLGMFVRGSGLPQVTDKFRLQIGTSVGTPSIGINLRSSKNNKQDIINFFKQEKNEMVSSLAHELKHVYDDFKKPERSIKARSKYSSAQDIWLGEVKPLNLFLYHLYFVHAIENLVRPSEIAGRMAAAGVTKKGFYDFLTNDRVFKVLKDIQNFTYDGLKKELLQYIPQIRQVLDDNNNSYDKRSKNKTIEKILEITYSSLLSSQARVTNSLLASKWAERLLGFTGDKEKFWNNYLASITKYGDDYDAYFRSEEKYFQKAATQVIKKISKLYDLAQDDEIQTESIINWELWHELLGNHAKLKDKLDF